MNGAQLIEHERRHNASKYSAKHDDAHKRGDLAIEAACLAAQGTDAAVINAFNLGETSRWYDWGLGKKHGHDRVKMLAMAGGLLAAEIDRLLREKRRAAAAPPQGQIVK